MRYCLIVEQSCFAHILCYYILKGIHQSLKSVHQGICPSNVSFYRNLKVYANIKCLGLNSFIYEEETLFIVQLYGESLNIY